MKKLSKLSKRIIGLLMVSTLLSNAVNHFICASAVGVVNQDGSVGVQQKNHVSITPDKNNIMLLKKSKDMFYAIADIWRDSFSYTTGCELEPGTFSYSYVNNTFMKYDTFVYVHEGRAIAMLMLVPAKLALIDGSSVEGYYVYAVGTLKEYRNNGIVTMMLDWVDEYSLSQGKKFRILNPDETSPWLYNFYSKRGYRMINCRQIAVSHDVLEQQAGDAQPMSFKDGIWGQDLYNRRKVNMTGLGFVEWPVDVLRDVQLDYKTPYKTYREMSFDDGQYAIVRCGRLGTNTIVIKEFHIKDENRGAFFKTLVNVFPGKNFVFEMPDSDRYSNFLRLGDYVVAPLSMINVKGAEEILSKVASPMYFNFGMD